MAESLSLSRVAIWKAIKSLSGAGYGIAASATGYALTRDCADSLNSWEFGADEKLIQHWAETDSTMNRAREAALASCPEGFVVVADAQNAGRGTGGKDWDSVPGGLFCTFVTRPKLDGAWAHRQLLAAQCALIRAISSSGNRAVFAGWPNDILVSTEGGSSKAGGILAECLIAGNQTVFLNIGIGVNLGEETAKQNYASIISGRKELLAAFRREFDLARYADESLVSEWNALCPDVNREIRYCLRNPFSRTTAQNPAQTDTASLQEMSGIFRGVDAMGFALIEELADNRSKEGPIINRYAPGHITIRTKGKKP
jgi:BirA family biotin operon repressor/biotin-[acetyl-CoA-carboxylase] ligase